MSHCHRKIYITQLHITSSLLGPTGQCSVTVSHNFEQNYFCFLMPRGHVTLSQKKNCVIHVYITCPLLRPTFQCTVTVSHNFEQNCFCFLMPRDHVTLSQKTYGFSMFISPVLYLGQLVNVLLQCHKNLY